MLKFILKSSCLLLLPICVSAQTAKDTVLTNGIRVGIDVAKIAYYFLTDKAHRSLEFSADVGYKKVLFVAEVGYSNIQLEKDGSFAYPNTDPPEMVNFQYNYKSNGLYGRIGIENNLLKGGDDVIFIGARYGISQFSFAAGNIVIPDPYFGEYTGSFPKQNAMAHWLEGVGGVKVKVLGNVYIGFTGRLKIRVAESDYTSLDAIFIPGFGKTGKNIIMGLSYYISYRLPFKQ